MPDTSQERLETIRRTFEHGPNPNGPQSFEPTQVFRVIGDLLAMLDTAAEREKALKEEVEQLKAEYADFDREWYNR